MNSAVYEMRKQRRFMEIWTAIGFVFICIFGSFTVVGLSTGIQLDPLHPIPIFAIIFSVSWSFTGMRYLNGCASIN